MNEETKVTQIVEQMKNGYEKGFADFYSQTYKYVYSRAKCMFNDEQEAADLTQEVYLAAYRNINSLKENESIFGWLRTITFYQGTKMLKKKRKEMLLSEESEDLFETIADEEEVENDYMEKQDIEIIRACINRLSEEQKAAILAYYYDNLKVDEIAELMELSEGTVKSRLYLARKNLKGFIEEEEKKQGYKLHSFGPVTLAIVLRSMLQENMELAGIREAGIFASVCQELNLALGEGAKKGILGAIAGLGAKKIAISVAAVIGAIVIGGVSIGTLTKKDDKTEEKNREEIKIEETVEEDVVEVQQWQKDYAKILMEVLYLSADRESRSEGWIEPELKLSDALDWLFIDASEETMYFGLMDINEDGIPELFVKTAIDDISYMFKIGDSIEECFLGRVNYVDTDTKEIIRDCTTNPAYGLGGKVIYTFDGEKLQEKSFFGEFDVGMHTTYAYSPIVTYSPLEHEDGEEITKERFEELWAQYSKVDQFALETYELSMENIELQLGIQISNKVKSLYQHIGDIYDYYGIKQETIESLVCKEIYFNNDEDVDYVITNTDYWHVLLVSGENEYYKYDDLEYGIMGRYYMYIEKEGKLIGSVKASYDSYDIAYEIYELNDRHELIYTGDYTEKFLAEDGLLVENPETGEYYRTYEYAGTDGSVREITKEEWDAAFGNTKEMEGGISIEEFFSQIDVDIQVAGSKPQGKNNSLENATHFTSVTASSTLPDEGKYNYSPSNVLLKDETCWVEGVAGYGEGEWIKLELPKKQLLSGLEIINGYALGTAKQYNHNSKITEVLIEFSNGESVNATLEVYDEPNKGKVQRVEFDKPVETSYVKLTIKGAEAGGIDDTCLTYVAPF